VKHGDIEASSLDYAVFPRRVHCLENQQEGIAIGRMTHIETVAGNLTATARSTNIFRRDQGVRRRRRSTIAEPADDVSPGERLLRWVDRLLTR